MPMWPRRLPLLGAVLTLVAAAIVAFAVIPPVRTDTFPLAAPDRAAMAFWGTALISLLVAAVALGASRFGASRDRLRRLMVGIAGAVALLTGVLLIDAARAFSRHGPDMRGVVVALWVCVGFYLAGGLMIAAAALVRRATPGRA